ncbi:unnamed protein product [Calicophoron daubneyi]|uniref:ferroxidase n=1 Tax=Calicophoron daubneyi TaxID=300641 RepID=A0AAV2T2K7_CALDB
MNRMFAFVTRYSALGRYSSVQLSSSQGFRPFVRSMQAGISKTEYEILSNETLENYAEVFDKIGERYDLGSAYDVQHAYGVLKVTFGDRIGTYIINRQTPNKQLWLSSPLTGPKRYDYNPSRQEWIYKNDGTALHALLEKEISEIVHDSIKFPKR